MNTQPEALRLAADLEYDHNMSYASASMSKHTPGPWGIIKGDGGPIIFSGSNGQAVAQAVRAFSISERDANARLIAAAPDLLEALKGVLAWGTEENWKNAAIWCEKARAAIAKAEAK